MAKKKKKVQSGYASGTANEALARQIFNNARKAAKLDKNRFALYDFLDFDSTRMHRRISSAVALVNEAKERVLKIHKDWPDSFLFEEDWFFLNSLSSPAFDSIEHTYYISFSAAIWILDVLREENLIMDFCERFPMDFDSLNDVSAPNVFDPCHSDEILRYITSIIQQRNSDCSEKNDFIVVKSHKLQRVFMDIATAKNKHHCSVPSRERFEYILGLIPEEKKCFAKRCFESCFWDWVDRYYRSLFVFLKDKQMLENKFLSLIPASHNSPNIPLIRGTDISSLKMANFTFGPNLSSNLGYAADFDSMLTTVRFVDNIVNKIIGFLYDIMSYKFISANSFEAKYGKDIAAIWSDFCIDNPYLMCIGFILLLDEGSDIPWVYTPCLSLLSYCAGYLPWAGSVPKSAVGISDDSCEDAISEDSHNPVLLDSYWDISNIYRINPVFSDSRDVFVQKRFNLAHVIYSATECLLPRNLNQHSIDMSVFDYFGVKDSQDIEKISLCAAILNAVKDQTMHELPLDDEELEDVDAEGDVEEVDNFENESILESQNMHIRALESKIAGLHSELKQYKKALHDAMREVREEQDRCRVLETKSEYDRRELADLRECVFNRQQEIESNDLQSVAVTFPCSVKKRVVVFGGHDSWAREIKPKLPEVRFIDRTMLPNADLIRHVDVIWIQSNALCHAFFYKIIDEARKYNIPVRYFSFASATKCAEQIVLDDVSDVS